MPANYTVTSQQHLNLVPGAGADAVVVTSAGRGEHGAAVPGGTGDIQVLVYDPVTKRWNVSLDAAGKVSVPGDVGPARPLLDQTTTLAQVRAEPVWFAGDPAPDLLIYGLDEGVNHPTGEAAVIQFRSGTADVVWRTALQNMGPPRIVGAPRRQQIRLAADYVTSQGGACCPVRTFHQTIGQADGSIVVTADDRPYLGAWVQPSYDHPGGALVLEVNPDSPAASVLRVGDVILSVAGQQTPRPGPDIIGQVDQLAASSAGSEVTLRVRRGTQTLNLPVRLGSETDNPDANTEVTGAGILGINLDTATVTITDEGAGPSQDAGLAVGDKLLTINHRPVFTMDDVHVALWGTAETPIPVTGLDAYGRRFTTQVTPRMATDTDPNAVAHVVL